jgi:hypothetical protein
MKTKFFLVIMTVFLFSTRVQSQDYTTSLGIRGGFPYGLTFKHFVNEDGAIELILSTLFRGVELTALYEQHMQTKEVPQLNLYFGGGVHAGYDDYSRWSADYSLGPVVGVDAIGGLEYTFDDLPLNVSLDLMPSLNMLGHFGFRINGGISVRYIFGY